MGYSTYFDGAIKVTPKIDPLTCTNLNIWLNMRHCKSNEMPNVTAEYADKAWEPDGPRIPSPSRIIDGFVAKRPKAKMFAFDELSSMVYVPDPPYGQNNQWAPELPQGSAHAYNEICYPHISLWSDVKIYQGYDCSYLAWDESEKAYEMGVWFEFLVNLLTKMGYACKGIVKAQGENDDDRWTVVCEDGTVKIDDSHDKAPTYEKELHEIKSRLATIWE